MGIKKSSNPNSKLKRWNAFFEEYSPKILYKPGKTNVVADALSRLQMNNITYQNHSSSFDSGTVHSAESSYEEIIAETNKPLNQFKQQLLISKNKFTIHEKVNNFDKTRHNLVTILKEFLQPNVVTGIHCTPEDLYEIPTILKNTFTNKFLYTKKFLSDVINRDDQQIIIEETHGRAHGKFDDIISGLNYMKSSNNTFVIAKFVIKINTIDTRNKFQFQKPQFQKEKANNYISTFSVPKN